MDPSLIAALGGLITAIAAAVVGVASTRSKVKMDDLATVQAKLDTATDDLAEEEAARRRDRIELESQHRIDRARIEAEHEERERQLQDRINVLQGQVAEATRTITKLDRVIFAARTYIARLLRVFADRDETPPPRPPELDE